MIYRQKTIAAKLLDNGQWEGKRFQESQLSLDFERRLMCFTEQTGAGVVLSRWNVERRCNRVIPFVVNNLQLSTQEEDGDDEDHHDICYQLRTMTLDSDNFNLILQVT